MSITNADLELLKAIALSYHSIALNELIEKLERQKAIQNEATRKTIAERRKTNKNYARGKK